MNTIAHAKLFINGKCQAVRISKAFEFTGVDEEIKKTPKVRRFFIMGVLIRALIKVQKTFFIWVSR